MTPPPEHPGVVSTAIDIAIVAVVLGSASVLAWSVYQGAARGVQALARWRKRKAWLRGPDDPPGGDE